MRDSHMNFSQLPFRIPSPRILQKLISCSMDVACTSGLCMYIDLGSPLASLASLDESEVVDEGTCLVTGGVAAGRRGNCADTPAFARSFAAFVAPELYKGSMYVLHLAISACARMYLVLFEQIAPSADAGQRSTVHSRLSSSASARSSTVRPMVGT